MQLIEQKPVEELPLELVDLPEQAPGSGQVRVRVNVCGVCHTDLHTVEGDIKPQQDYRVGTRYRMWFPYELAWAFQRKKLSAFGEFLTPDRESYSAFCLSDPLPHLVEQLYLVSSQLNRWS